MTSPLRSLLADAAAISRIAPSRVFNGELFDYPKSGDLIARASISPLRHELLPHCGGFCEECSRNFAPIRVRLGNERRQRLTLARDRFRHLPLY